MRAKCIVTTPSEEQTLVPGKSFVPGRTEYPVEPGVEYTILGLGFWDGLVWFEIAASMRTVVSVPAVLFEVTSGKPSRHWDIRLHADGALTLWPRSFYHRYYHDHLSEGRSGAVEDFRSLYGLLEREAATDMSE
jgi:hypothetical protein